MLRTGRPRRIDEGIVKRLLEIVDDSLLQLFRVIGKRLMKRKRRHDRVLIATSNSLGQVVPEQFHQSPLDGHAFDHKRLLIERLDTPTAPIA